MVFENLLASDSPSHMIQINNKNLFIIIFDISRHGFMYSKLVSNLLCSKLWPWIPDPMTSTSWVLELQTYVAVPWIYSPILNFVCLCLGWFLISIQSFTINPDHPLTLYQTPPWTQDLSISQTCANIPTIYYPSSLIIMKPLWRQVLSMNTNKDYCVSREVRAIYEDLS